MMSCLINRRIRSFLGCLLVITSFRACSGDASGLKFYRLLRDFQVTLSGTALISEFFTPAKKLCPAKCVPISDCFGFEYDSGTGRCRLIRGTGKANSSSFPSTSAPGVDVYWMHGINVRKMRPDSLFFKSSKFRTITKISRVKLRMFLNDLDFLRHNGLPSVGFPGFPGKRLGLLEKEKWMQFRAISMIEIQRYFTHSLQFFQCESPWTIEAHCPTLPDYGPFAISNDFASSPKAYNSIINLECKKWSAFNAAQLVAKGYSTGGATPTDDDRFKRIPLKCTKGGTWEPGPELVPECQDFLNCLRTPRGKEYRGTAYTTTTTGKTCLVWNQVPGVSTWSSGSTTGLVFAGGSLSSQGNNCRNPGRDKTRPWCYVTITTWEYCDIPMCQDPTLAALECRFTTDGYEYLGKVSVTAGNAACVSWDFAYVTNTKTYSPHFPDDDAIVTHNYCRNPGRTDSAEPWCYTCSSCFIKTSGTCATATNLKMCRGFP